MNDKIDISKLKEIIKSVKENSELIIKELESGNPNEVIICDLAVEKMGELVNEINSIVFGSHTMID